MPKAWISKRIGELGRVVTGKTPSTKTPENFDGPYPFITIPDLDGRVYITETSRTLSEKGALAIQGAQLPAGAVMISCIATVGRCGITSKPSFTNQQINSVIPNNTVDARFLYYAFTQLGKELERTGGGGSVYTNVSKSRFSNILVRIPSRLSEQREIAAILGALDDKIELNRRMSEVRDEIAVATHEAWFQPFSVGENLPPGWTRGPLDQFFEIAVGGVWGESSQTAKATESVHCLRGIDCHDLSEVQLPDVPVRWISKGQLESRELSTGTVLIEGSGSFCGRSLVWTDSYRRLFERPITYSNFVKRLRPKVDATQAIVAAFGLREAYKRGVVQAFRTGTAFPNLDVKGLLAGLEVVVPPAEIAEKFVEIYAPERRVLTLMETQSLHQIRNTLLPKLISGELRVPDAERLVSEVA